MKVSRNAALASIAVLAVAGISGTALAQTRDHPTNGIHVETVRLPDGSLERISYTGNRAPEVRVMPVSLSDFPALPPGFFDIGSPLAGMERISAEINAQAAAMMRQADSLDSVAFGMPGNITRINLRNLPSGTEGYSEVSTLSGGHVCTETMRYFSAGPGKKPHVERTTSGDCHVGNGLAHHAFHRMSPAPGPSLSAPNAIKVDYRPSTGTVPHVHDAVWHGRGPAD